MPIKKKTNLRRRKVAAKGRRRGFRKARDVRDYASLSVQTTLTGEGSTQYSTNKMYVNRSTNMGMFPRSQDVAKGYQHYRITKLTMTFKPNLDTFSGNSGSQKTFLYWMIDKSGSIPANISLEGLKQMGAKPIALDEKPIKISWRPSVRQEVQTQLGAAGANKYSISPWLTCNQNGANPGLFQPSTVEHWGLYFYVEQQGGGNAYGVELEAQFQFKKPANTALLADDEAVTCKPALLDSSSNGIVDDIA